MGTMIASMTMLAGLLATGSATSKWGPVPTAQDYAALAAQTPFLSPKDFPALEKIVSEITPQQLEQMVAVASQQLAQLPAKQQEEVVTLATELAFELTGADEADLD